MLLPASWACLSTTCWLSCLPCGGSQAQEPCQKQRGLLPALDSPISACIGTPAVCFTITRDPAGRAQDTAFSVAAPLCWTFLPRESCISWKHCPLPKASWLCNCLSVVTSFGYLQILSGASPVAALSRLCWTALIFRRKCSWLESKASP